MEKDRGIHIPGMDTQHIRYKKNFDGSPMVTMALIIEPEIAEWMGTPNGKVVYDVKDLKS